MSAVSYMLNKYGTAVAVYRSPAASGGKTAAMAVSTASLRVILSPAPVDGPMVAAVPELAGGRSSHLGIADDSADIRHGDELRVGSTTYTVNGVGTWRNVLAIALSKIEI